jgi:ABC-type branched-subunit amino acid transport system permease subunit
VKWSYILWSYYLSAVLFLIIGLVLLRWEKDIFGIASILLSATLVIMAEDTYQATKNEDK